MDVSRRLDKTVLVCHTRDMTTIHTSHRPTHRFLGRCTKCVLPIAVENAEARWDNLGDTCPTCGVKVILERVYGTLDTMTCDSRCEGAIGSSCVCACGGENHGGAFLQTGTALASAVEAYRRTTERRVEAAAKRSATKAQHKAEALTSWQADEADLIASVNLYAADNFFLADLARQALTSEWTPRQAAAAQEVVTQMSNRNAAKAAAEQARIEALESGLKVSEGSQTIAGTVTKVWSEPNPFARGIVYKMRLQTASGLTWVGTCPVGLLRSIQTPETLVGRQVSLDATVKESSNSPLIGWFSRPRSAQLV